MLCGVVNVLYLFGIVHFNCVSGLLFSLFFFAHSKVLYNNINCHLFSFWLLNVHCIRIPKWNEETKTFCFERHFWLPKDCFVPFFVWFRFFVGWNSFEWCVGMFSLWIGTRHCLSLSNEMPQQTNRIEKNIAAEIVDKVHVYRKERTNW